MDCERSCRRPATCGQPGSAETVGAATVPKGWSSRGYLPHFDGGAITQSMTFRLEDSLPQARVRLWRQQLRLLPQQDSERRYRTRVEAFLDRGAGSAWLRDPTVATMIQDALLH